MAGAPLYDEAGSNTKSDAGRAYVINAAGAVRLTIPHPEPAAGDKFGASVAADAANGRIFVGAPERDIVVRAASPSGSQSSPAGGSAPAGPAGADLDIVRDPGGAARVVDRSTGRVVHEIAAFVTYDPAASQPAASAPPLGSDGEPDDDDPAYYEDSKSPPPVLELDPDTGMARLVDADTRNVLASVQTGPAASSSGRDGAEPEAPRLVAFSNARTGTSYVYEAATARLSMTEYIRAGAVYAFNSSTGAHLSPPMLNPHPGSWERFGYSIDVMANGNLAVGAPSDEPRRAGSVYVMDGSTKAQVHRLANPSAPHGAGDDFGTAVAAAGNYLVIGAPDDDGADNAGPHNSGAIYIYDGASGTRKAYLPAAAHASSASRSDDFGEAVAGSADGRLAVGGSEDGGYVLAFSFDGTDASLAKKMEPSDPAYRRFGSGLAVSGADKNIAVGDYFHRPHGTVFLYDSRPPLRPNSPPAATDDSATVAEDSPGSAIVVLSNDTDSDGDALRVASVNTKGTRGTASVPPGPAPTSVLFAPEADFAGTTSFSYMVSDGNGGTAAASVSVTVTPVNDAPAAVPDSASVAEDGRAVIRVLDNDADADGDSLSLHSVDGSGARGTAAAGPDGTVAFSPSPDATGDTSFTYRASDGNGGISEPARVVVIIEPVHDAPAAVPDSVSTPEDEPVVVLVLSNDTDADAGDFLRVSSVTPPSHGTAAADVDGTEIEYAPYADYHGTDSFSYGIVDSTGLTSTATVSVTVESVNDAPFVAPIPDRSVRPGGTLSFTAVAVDYDSDTTVFSLSGYAPPGASIDPASGAFAWTPSAGQVGLHAFSVRAADSGTPPLSGSEDFTVTVLDLVPLSIEAPADVLAEAGGPLTRVVLGTATATDNAPGLEVTNDAPPSFPLGETVVTWTARDRSGNSDADTQTVTVRDTTPPVVTPPPDIRAEAAGFKTAVDTGMAAAADAADPAVEVTSDAPGRFPLGETVVTWTARDRSGNSATAVQRVVLTPPTETILHETFDSMDRWIEGRLPYWRSAAPGEPGHPPEHPLPNRVAKATGCAQCVMTLGGIDLSGYSSASMSMWRYMDPVFPWFGTIYLQVLPDDGAMWDTVRKWSSSTDSGRWDTETFDLSEYVGISDLKIMLTANGGGLMTNYLIDDLVISGTPVLSDSPPAVSVSDFAVVRGSSATAPVSASDPDGDRISLSMSGNPGFVRLVDGDSGPAVVASPTGSDAGVHRITVTASAGSKSSTDAFSVHVIGAADATAPALKAPGDLAVEASSYTSVVSLGAATASDDSGAPPSVTNDAPDGFPVGTTTVTWTATDSFGNASTDTQTVTVRDTTAPVLEVDPVPVAYGGTFVHQAVAIDAVDGDLTGSVAKTGTVDTSAVGTYPVAYSVSDSAGNTARFSGAVRVMDRDYPIITISGSTSVLIKTGGSFTDPGATAVDQVVNTPVRVRTWGPPWTPRPPACTTYTIARPTRTGTRPPPRGR